MLRLFLVSRFTKLGQRVLERHGKTSVDVSEQASTHERNKEELIPPSLESENVEAI